MYDNVKTEVIDLTEENEVEVKAEDLSPVKEIINLSDGEDGESKGLQQSPSGRCIRNVDKCIDKAIEELKKGQSLVLVASHYKIPQEVLYDKLVSRSLPSEIDLLTNAEEENLVKWILKSNSNNSLVLKQQLMEKVGKYKKVMNISPIFAKSKFGRMWYEYFMKTHPEIYENDGLLMPVDKVLVQSSSQDSPIKKLVTQPSDPENLYLLTPNEENALVDWIITSNQQNALVFKDQLIKRVCRLSKVAKSIPGFAKSKTGKTWYDRFLKTHPEIYENDELLLPSENFMHPSAKLISYGIKDAVVVLYDFKKLKHLPIRLVSKDTYVLQKSGNDKEHHKLEDVKSNGSDNDDTMDEHLENKSTIEIFDVAKELPSSEESGIESDNCSVEKYKDDSYIPYKRKSVRRTRRKSKPSSERPICHKCVKTFCNFSKLKRHILAKHQPQEYMQAKCFDCKKVFPSKIHLQVHVRNAHRTTYFFCEECGQPFKHRTSMRKHQRTIHEGLDVTYDRFFCDVCEKGFKYKNSLEAHVLYGHLRENKKFPCDICKKTFIKRSAMLRHRLRHSKIKPLKCMHCGKRTSRKYLLEEHIKNHHKDIKLENIKEEH